MQKRSRLSSPYQHPRRSPSHESTGAWPRSSPPSLAQESHLDRPLRDEFAGKAFEALESAGDAAARLYSNAEAFGHYAEACDLEGAGEAARARVREKQGDFKGALAAMERYALVAQQQGQKPSWCDERLAQLRAKAQ